MSLKYPVFSNANYLKADNRNWQLMTDEERENTRNQIASAIKEHIRQIRAKRSENKKSRKRSKSARINMVPKHLRGSSLLNS